MLMKRVFIYVVSCRRRSLDAKKLSDYLSKNDYKVVYKPEDADTIVFITCAFIDKLAEYSLNKVKELQKYNAELIVAGCLPAIEKEKLAEIFDGKTISTKNYEEIYRFFPEKKTKFSEIDDANKLYDDVNLDNSVKVLKKTLSRVKWLDAIFFKFRDYVIKKRFGESLVVVHSKIPNFWRKFNRRLFDSK